MPAANVGQVDIWDDEPEEDQDDIWDDGPVEPQTEEDLRAQQRIIDMVDQAVGPSPYAPQPSTYTLADVQRAEREEPEAAVQAFQETKAAEEKRNELRANYARDNSNEFLFGLEENRRLAAAKHFYDPIVGAPSQVANKSDWKIVRDNLITEIPEQLLDREPKAIRGSDVYTSTVEDKGIMKGEIRTKEQVHKVMETDGKYMTLLTAVQKVRAGGWPTLSKFLSMLDSEVYPLQREYRDVYSQTKLSDAGHARMGDYMRRLSAIELEWMHSTMVPLIKASLPAPPPTGTPYAVQATVYIYRSKGGGLSEAVTAHNQFVAAFINDQFDRDQYIEALTRMLRTYHVRAAVRFIMYIRFSILTDQGQQRVAHAAKSIAGNCLLNIIRNQSDQDLAEVYKKIPSLMPQPASTDDDNLMCGEPHSPYSHLPIYISHDEIEKVAKILQRTITGELHTARRVDVEAGVALLRGVVVAREVDVAGPEGADLVVLPGGALGDGPAEFHRRWRAARDDDCARRECEPDDRMRRAAKPA
jgi:hypothetical protein